MQMTRSCWRSRQKICKKPITTDNVDEIIVSIIRIKNNSSKTKVTVFSRCKIRNKHKFYFGDALLDVADHYKYQGINFNCKFTTAKKQLYENGKRDNR